MLVSAYLLDLKIMSTTEISCGGKSASFHLFSGSLRQSNRNSKGSEKQIAKSGGDEGLMILEFRGYWGGWG